jgi:hypothetical protein
LSSKLRHRLRTIDRRNLAFPKRIHPIIGLVNARFPNLGRRPGKTREAVIRQNGPSQEIVAEAPLESGDESRAVRGDGFGAQVRRLLKP